MNNKAILVGVFALSALTVTSENTFANATNAKQEMATAEFGCCGYGMPKTKKEIKEDKKAQKKATKEEAKTERTASKSKTKKKDA